MRRQSPTIVLIIVMLIMAAAGGWRTRDIRTGSDAARDWAVQHARDDKQDRDIGDLQNKIGHE
jgi:hypothetical protein